MSISDPKNSIFLLILIIASFFVYITTTSPVVYLGDSGELTAAAFSLGIPHGSGYPLYTLIGKVFCLIPLGNTGFRMNLMSVFFAVVTLWLVYSLIVRITASNLAAFVATLTLAFVSVFWLQTVSSEVYVLHSFFVVILVKILWWWDERREFPILILFVFVTGISFGNHLQTVMLAPAALFLVLTGEKRTLFSPKNAMVLSVFFIAALSMYLYLPIRTEAGAAIHWGDPNTLDRFLAHVSGQTHRSGYVLNKSLPEYLLRTKETLWFVVSQFGVILFFSVWGWFKLTSGRWRVFFVLVIVFDFVYTIFLNIISLEITPFILPTFVVLSLLAGVGISDLLKKFGAFSSVGLGAQRLIRTAFAVIPAIFLFMNYGLCNQSRNYTAYEHAINIFRTMRNGNILFLEGDNNFFPVVYGRIVERMREDLILFDRHDIIYKLPYLGEKRGQFTNDWRGFRALLEESLILKMEATDVNYAVFDHDSIILPAEYTFVPQGMLFRVVKNEELTKPYKMRNLWKYYSTESFYDHFERDYHHRQIVAFFYFRQGQYLYMAENPKQGFKYFRKASEVGYNDTGIHSALANFYSDHGLFEEARLELEKTLVYHTNMGVVHNNWGVYHYKRRAYEDAIKSFQKAIRLNPKSFRFYKNLGHSMYESGRREEAVQAFEASFAINENQPELEKFMRENGLK
jgi:tetratricopeptide (TPR) repeat protein